MQDLERRTGHDIKLAGVLPTFHDGRLRACREAMGAMRELFRDGLRVPQDVKVVGVDARHRKVKFELSHEHARIIVSTILADAGNFETLLHGRHSNDRNRDVFSSRSTFDQCPGN